MTGAPFRTARSMTLQIFSACASRERAAEHGEVLGEDVDQPAVDPAVAGDDAVAGHDLLGQPEIGGAVGDEPVELDEAALVEQQIEPLARGELPFLVLLRDPRGAAALLGQRLPMMELFQQCAGFRRRAENIPPRPMSPAGVAAGEFSPDVDDDLRRGLESGERLNLPIDIEGLKNRVDG